LQGANIPK